MDSEQPTAKRTRVEDEQTVSPALTAPTYERPADFWIDDGNTVLQVEKTQFRVHRSTLRSNSSFFDGMFSAPQPPNALTVEGCHLVHCTGDSAQDWKNILKLMYDPISSRWLHHFSVPYLTSIIRLGKKYGFNSIRDEALERIKWRVPSSLEEWDEDMSPLDPSSLPDGYYGIQDEEFNLINIAEEVGIQSILPGLYYICAVNIKIDHLFKGIKNRNGSISRLSPASQRIVVDGQSKILHFMASQTMAWIFEKKTPHQACITPTKCSTQRVEIMRLVVPTILGDLRFVLDEFTDLTKLRFCSPCLTHIEKVYQDARTNFWKELPSMFGLPEWEAMKDLGD